MIAVASLGTMLRRLFPAAVLFIGSVTTSTASAQTIAPHWVGTWAASQQVPTAPNALPQDDLQSATLRQIVHLSLGGEQLRLRLSNVFGTEPLHLLATHIAVPMSASAAKIDPATDRAVTFDGGKSDVIIPAGAEYVSDPISFHAAPLSNVAITLQYGDAPVVQTGHPGSRSTSYLSHGVDVSAADMPDAQHLDRWFQISGIEVASQPEAVSIVAFGDSITDGHGATTNGNDRWPDDLAVRLQAESQVRTRAVVNQGLGGNRLLLDGSGPNALARFGRDVLAQTNARYVIVMEGVNDLGVASRVEEISPAEHVALVARIIGAYQQMIGLAHGHGLRIYGATITPYTGSEYYHPSLASEADRQAINAWIRTPSHFDTCIDFDKVVADPAQPSRLAPKYDSGDHLHPSAAGYKAMAGTIQLALFR